MFSAIYELWSGAPLERDWPHGGGSTYQLSDIFTQSSLSHVGHTITG